MPPTHALRGRAVLGLPRTGFPPLEQLATRLEELLDTLPPDVPLRTHLELLEQGVLSRMEALSASLQRVAVMDESLPQARWTREQAVMLAAIEYGHALTALFVEVAAIDTLGPCLRWMQALEQDSRLRDGS